ncbi:MAG: ATP-binding cassette domain-containing protein [Saprospiraceae bacterium]|nr:ATP-binding cassette domain-containing protein [Saprospiraceae bacterium]
MLIRLDGIGKRYNHWIFRNVIYEFAAGSYGISGSNGSGKSTLLRIISGYLTPSEGSLAFLNGSRLPIDRDLWAPMVSFCGPDIELIHELTLGEHCSFHFRFKQMYPGLSLDDFFAITRLEEHRELRVGELSSGLYQRFELGLTLLSSSPVILLDEPTSYLDRGSRSWFVSVLQQYSDNRIIVIASNDQADLNLCNIILKIEDYQS